MKVFLPYRGEFGHKIMWHVPCVHGQPGPKTICCEPGEECLFPSAARHVIVHHKPDRDRREWLKYDRAYLDRVRYEVAELGELVEPLPKHPDGKAQLKHFVPEPWKRHGILCDVVICPRMRSYGPKKNWPHWEKLARQLGDRFSVFAAGGADSSCELPCPRAWDYQRFTDASTEAMLSAGVVVATDSGLAHLALLCGRPLVLISHRQGLTAPTYRRINWKRYVRSNHRDVPVRVVPHAWDRPESVVPWVTALVNELPRRRQDIGPDGE